MLTIIQLIEEAGLDLCTANSQLSAIDSAEPEFQVIARRIADNSLLAAQQKIDAARQLCDRANYHPPEAVTAVN